MNKIMNPEHSSIKIFLFTFRRLQTVKMDRKWISVANLGVNQIYIQ